MTESYFFDSYAFFEILKGNPQYAKYRRGINILTTRLNLMELHYGVLVNKGREAAGLQYDDFLKYTLEIDDDSIKAANEFRLLHKKRGFSYIDCIGYIMARAMNARFLTGDREFEGMENVEFVK